VVADEPDVRLVDERRRVERVTGPLPRHAPQRDATQRVVDEREQLPHALGPVDRFRERVGSELE
jgi:hypothetical protein